MKRFLLLSRSLLNRNPSSINPSRSLCNLPDQDEAFISIRIEIVRLNRKWKPSFNTPFISQRLKPRHVEEVLIKFFNNDLWLFFRFFDFIKRNFGQLTLSTLSLCICAQAIVRGSKMYLHAPIFAFPKPNRRPRVSIHYLFECLSVAYYECPTPSTLGFDSLAEPYVLDMPVLDAVTVIRLMWQLSLMPEIRTLSSVLNGLLRIRRFGLASDLFDEVVQLDIRIDVYE